MDRLFSFLIQVTDPRQAHKVQHTLSDIVLLVFFAHLANCDEWDDIHYFAQRYETTLKHVLTLENGIPSRDTIRRMMGMIHPNVLVEINQLWNELISESNRQATGKFLAIDGKTMRGNRQKETLPLHIVTAYSVQEGLCFGQVAVKEKSNEITAIPQLLNTLQLKGQTVTIDAMGTQVEIAAQIHHQKGFYVLAVKGNQGLLHEEIRDYLEDVQFEKEIKTSDTGYFKTVESARSQVETREYYQTDCIDWMVEKGRWAGLKTIGKVVTTIEKDGQETQDIRYYISNSPTDIFKFKAAVRGHWGIESMHWHLDVTFGEDANHTLNKNAAQNLTIIRKMAIPLLKNLPLDQKKQRLSLRKRRFVISLDFPFYFGMLYEMYFTP